MFTAPHLEGFIGYRVESGCAIVLGEPACAPHHKEAFVRAFNEYCQKERLDIIYTIVSQEFVDFARAHGYPVAIQFGTKLVFDPAVDPLSKHGSKAVLVRKKAKHAVKDNVSVSEYLNNDEEIKAQITAIGNSWLEKRHGAQIYLAHLKIFDDSEGKRWFIAKQEERIVGFIVLHQLQAINGWLMNTLITTQDAPHGASELLVVSALKTLGEEGCSQVIVGPVVSRKLDSIQGLVR